MWTLWKRRNARRHSGDINFHNMVLQVQTLIRQLIVMWFPWMNRLPDDWPTMVQMLRRYKPKLYYQSVAWRPLEGTFIKCNTNRGCRGNPGLSTYGFCLRNSEGNLIYAQAEPIGVTTNMEAEARAILEALKVCTEKGLQNVILEKNSLCMMNFLRGLWKIPWEMADIYQAIIREQQLLNIQVTHVFKEGNYLADSLANRAYEQEGKQIYNNFQELPSICRKILNADKSQIPNIQIKTLKIRGNTGQFSRSH
ncbi:hypothetical protein KY289_024322 [Solanum tuberosum]|nr:hypothetical protein KY289_024322 [Solanum tuberosum]